MSFGVRELEIVVLILLIFVFIAAVILKSPAAKGYFGEKSVQLFTSLRLDSAVYHRIDDVTLGDSGETTQIDHVFVSEYGIFVVETKNMKGWIFGGENQSEWTQTVFRKSSKFQNPLRQNYKHLKAIQALLGVPSTAIHSVVVFVGDSEFKTPMPSNVTHLGGLVTYIRSFTSPVLTKEQVDGVVEKLAQARLPATRDTARKHVQNLKARSGKMDSSTACPRCRASLVLRTSKNAAQSGNQFLGCAAFPKCRYTRSFT